jgi:hypothetical protein
VINSFLQLLSNTQLCICTTFSANPGTWEVFTSSSFLYCFFQCFTLFIVEVFHFTKFVLRYLFEGIVNGNVFLISFLACLFLIYRKAAYFCMLILYPASLLKVFIRSKRFLLRSSGSFKYRIIIFCK